MGRKELTELSVKKEILELENKVLNEFADREDNDLEAGQLLDLKKKLSEIKDEIFKAKLYIVSRSTGLLQRQMENTINEEMQNLEEKIKQLKVDYDNFMLVLEEVEAREQMYLTESSNLQARLEKEKQFPQGSDQAMEMQYEMQQKKEQLELM